MPIYEYQCPKCGKFDVLQKMSDKPLKTHDICGSKVRKLLSASSFSFKGSGFYITDYKRSSSSPTSEKKTEGSSDAAGNGKAKSETTSSSPSKSKENGTGSNSSKEKAA